MDISERGLEVIVSDYLRDVNGYSYSLGKDAGYDKELAMIPCRLESFLKATQPDAVKETAIFSAPTETKKFYNRLRDDITKRGITDILRNGYNYNGRKLDLYYPTPDERNKTAQDLYRQNDFLEVRQLFYSQLNNNSVDLVIFINGLPLMTIELKNALTGQHTDEAIKQYKNDRDSNELLFKFKRCAVHFAVDDSEVWMCTKLENKDSWFLPFNKGNNGGAGNPVNPNGFKTSYFWENILSKELLSVIIEDFSKVVKMKDKKTNKWKEKNIWPRYHQLDAVLKIVDATRHKEIGEKFLIQHSAGSGKSNTLTWLAYQLVNLKDESYNTRFDSVIVVTDRINLDEQIKDNINAFVKLTNNVGWASDSNELKNLLLGGKKIIITIINKFAFILDEIGTSLKKKHFAIIIDEAHSSQNGSLSGSMAAGVAGFGGDKDEEEDLEDRLERIIAGRKLAKNANYYAFTATPKGKTLEMFGEPYTSVEGKIMHKPFHEYTMKQAIEEGFILNVLDGYQTYTSYYNILKSTEDNLKFDSKKAQSVLRSFVESQPETILKKSEVIVEHFCSVVYKKIGGKARAMVVTSSINRAIEFYYSITTLLQSRNSQYKAIVAFTDKEIDGKKYTESMVNGFPSSEIEEKIEEDPYRILIVADKFQTGYDQPLLHTMYVDKELSSIRAVQTLSRLNRCYPKKTDTFVLDFCNDTKTIEEAFQKYYKKTELEGTTDINKLNDLRNIIEDFPFYTEDDVDNVVALFLMGADEERPKLESILDSIVVRFKEELDEDQMVKAKSAMKNFIRLYNFVASITPYKSKDWEKRFEFYMLLVKKLPILKFEDFTAGLLDNIDFDKYLLQKNEMEKIELEDADSVVNPVPVGNPNGKSNPDMEELSKIVDDFNSRYGAIEWKNAEEVTRQIMELPERMASCVKFVNAMRNSDEQTAQVEFNNDMQNKVAEMLEEKTEFVQMYFSNREFQEFVNQRVYNSMKKTIQNEYHFHGDTHIDTFVDRN